MSAFSCEKYIQYHRQPHSKYLTMNEFNVKFNTLMYDPQIEASVCEQHVETSDFQEFRLVRTDLMTKKERQEYFANFK